MVTIVDCLRESTKSLGLILKPGWLLVSLSVLGGKDVLLSCQMVLKTLFVSSACLRPAAEK